MRAEPVAPLAGAPPPGESSATARTLGALCFGAAVLALLAARARTPPRTAVVKSPQRHLFGHVIPAHAGIHAEPAAQRRHLSGPLPQHVIPAHAGIHAEYAGTRPLSGATSDQAFLGSPPARGRRVEGGGQTIEAAGPPAQHGPLAGAPSPAPGRRVETSGLYQAASLLALSVLLDSAVEHYRGQFENPGMFAPLVTSLATTFAATGSGLAPQARRSNWIYTTALAIGAAGSAFHVYNVWRRPGGFSWQNLFYAAPLGAPAALSLAGAFGLAANRLAVRPGEPLFGLPANRALCALAGIGMAGSAAEAGLLHFRGAYHRPAMWLPVTMPPVAAVFLLRAAAGARDRLARAWLGLTALLGVAGVGFHASGVVRQMGGWRNWRQNILSGPPLPAPPSFLALALAGRAALAK